MKTAVHQDVYTGRYTAILLGGEFPNCHGEGNSEAESLTSLRLLVNLKRRKTTNQKD